MALDFPSNPVDGQVSGNFVWSASTGAWKSKPTVGSVTIQSPTKPSSANPGDIWINTTDGTAFTYFNDGTTTQWMEILSSGVPSLATKADLSYTNTQLGLKANLAGAAFSGNVSTPAIGLGGVTSPTQKLDTSGRIKLRSDGGSSAGMWITDNAGTETAFFGAAGLSSSDQIGIYHNNAWRLQVDSSGRITTPSQPAFFAYRTSGLWAATVWTTDGTLFNTGGHYNGGNGRFTAPVAGRYFFALNSIGHTSGTTRLYPRINGVNQLGSFHLRVIDTSNFGDGHMTWSFNLAAGDYVDIYLGEGYNYSDGSCYAFWHGYLIG